MAKLDASLSIFFKLSTVDTQEWKFVYSLLQHYQSNYDERMVFQG